MNCDVSRWTGQCFILQRQVWFHPTDRGGMECLIGLGGNLSQEPGIGAFHSPVSSSLHYHTPAIALTLSNCFDSLTSRSHPMEKHEVRCCNNICCRLHDPDLDEKSPLRYRWNGIDRFTMHVKLLPRAVWATHMPVMEDLPNTIKITKRGERLARKRLLGSVIVVYNTFKIGGIAHFQRAQFNYPRPLSVQRPRQWLKTSAGRVR